MSVQAIFQSDEFNDLNLKDFCDKFKNERGYKKLRNLKKVFSSLLMPACILSKDAFDSNGNRTEGWGEGEQRGKMDYFPPLGWVGFGLKVMNKYKNDIWIGMENVKGEWCVAYHGVGGVYPSEEINIETLTSIMNEGLKENKENFQRHQNCPDVYHRGKKVGRGIYCSPYVNTAKKFAGRTILNGKKYYTVFMLRVKPKKIRHCENCEDSREPNCFWVLNGENFNEVRPYRILFKCFDDNNRNQNN